LAKEDLFVQKNSTFSKVTRKINTVIACLDKYFIATNNKAYLNHSRMITNIVSRPGGPILHCPSFFRNFLGFSNQGIDSDLEFLILSLGKKKSMLSFIVYQQTPSKRDQSSILIKRINKVPSSLSSHQQSLPPPCLSSSLFSVGSTTLEHEVQY